MSLTLDFYTTIILHTRVLLTIYSHRIVYHGILLTRQSSYASWHSSNETFVASCITTFFKRGLLIITCIMTGKRTLSIVTVAPRAAFLPSSPVWVAVINRLARDACSGSGKSLCADKTKRKRNRRNGRNRETKRQELKTQKIEQNHGRNCFFYSVFHI